VARLEGQLELRILGPLDVSVDGERVGVGGRKQREVLAVLATRSGAAVSTDALIEAVWPEGPPATALTTLQVYVSRLRKVLGAGTIVSEGGGYRLALEPRQLDSSRFEQLTAKAAECRRAGRFEEAAGAIREALSLWRGPPLADFAYEGWAQPHIGRLDEERLACCEDRFDLELAAGRHTDLVGELQQLVREQPLRERLHGQLLLALYRSGRQADALAAYQDARTKLVEELGIEPGPELQELNRRILNQDPALAAPARPVTTQSTMPAPATALIGRGRELEQLAALIRSDDVRLVTLTGPGGVGKTRLALELAVGAAADFPEGVEWVSLQALRDPALVVPTIAQQLGAEDDPARLVGSARMLLVLDNFEQVTEASVEIAGLLGACPGLTVLVTSREPLRVAAEHEFALPPLAAAEAVALFTERATAIRPGLVADGDVSAICERLDRLPLALELAAARVNALPPKAILERLDDRLGLLTRGGRDKPLRHQTLRQTIGWSYELMDEPEQRLFARLGVFSGGCTLGAAETVCDGDLDGLASLIDKSLVRLSGDGDHEPRYTMLETIREYAAERLAEADPGHEVARRHLGWFLDLAGRAEAGLRSRDEQEWLRRLDRDHDNFRSALSLALEIGDVQAAVLLAARLSRFWLVRGFLAEATGWLERSLAAGGDAAARAPALRWLAIFEMEQGEVERPTALAEEALALHRSADDELGVARTLDILGDTAVRRLDLDRASELFREGIETARRIDARPELGTMLYDLGIVYRFQRMFEPAEALLQEAREVFRELGFARGQGSALQGLADVARERGDHPAGIAAVAEALDLYAGLAWVGGVLNCLEQLAELFAATGEPDRAATIWGAHAARCDEIGRERSHPIEAPAREEAIGAARAALGDRRFEQAWAEGAELDLDRATAYALAGVRPASPTRDTAIG
jgi:predicted ATPase/DNA-binding SARP family transcriptional activator